MAERTHPNADLATPIAMRIGSSLLCALSASVLGLVQPVFWYLVWSAVFPGIFGHEYQFLLPVLVATVGVIGGAFVGLVVGALAPRSAGASGARVASFCGLGFIHTALGIYLLCVTHDAEVAILAMFVPTVVVDLAVAGGFWLLGMRHFGRNGSPRIKESL